MEEARHVARLEQRITRRGLRGRGQVPGNGLLIEMRRDGNDLSGHGGNGVLPAHRIVVEDEHASRPGVCVHATDAADAPQGLLELTGEGRVALQPTDLETYASRQGMDDPDRSHRRRRISDAAPRDASRPARHFQPPWRPAVRAESSPYSALVLAGKAVSPHRR